MTHRRRARRLMLALPMALSLPGCFLDPYAREGSWRPSAANEANLRLQVADPRDLQQGTGERGSDGQFAADAVSRLRSARNNEVAATALPIQSTAAGIAAGGGATGAR